MEVGVRAVRVAPGMPGFAAAQVIIAIFRAETDRRSVVGNGAIDVAFVA